MSDDVVIQDIAWDNRLHCLLGLSLVVRDVFIRRQLKRQNDA